MSNTELIQLVDTAPIIYEIGATTVVRLSKALLLKCGESVLPCEAKTLQLVAEKTAVPVPRVHRSFQVKDDSMYFGTRGYIVMDYIDGENLGDCWKRLTSEQKKDVVRQTADIMKQLQATVLEDAGPLGGGYCRGRFFTDYSAGPFNTALEMQNWFNHKLDICQHYKKGPADIPRFKFREYVLVHQDISPRNMILDSSGQIWLIDRADAGAYPPAFEEAALTGQRRFPEFNKMLLSLIPTRPSEVRQLLSIGYGLTVASFA